MWICFLCREFYCTAAIHAIVLCLRGLITSLNSAYSHHPEKHPCPDSRIKLPGAHNLLFLITRSLHFRILITRERAIHPFIFAWVSEWVSEWGRESERAEGREGVEKRGETGERERERERERETDWGMKGKFKSVAQTNWTILQKGQLKKWKHNTDYHK